VKTPGKSLAGKITAIAESRKFSIRSGSLPTWCPGCGYFGIHQGINDAIQQTGIAHHRVVVVSGVGCAGRYPFFVNAYGFHSAHGRALPVATGVKTANPELTVFAVGGDGDGIGIGGGHLPHVARKDININYILFDNSIYGLTKGQPSPSSPIGLKTKASPGGNDAAPLNATLMALAYGASFVARLYAGDPRAIATAVLEGIKHPGFSFFHVYTSCVTFDKQNKTWDHLRERTHSLPRDYDASDQKNAMNLVLDDDYAMGIIYKKKGNRPEDQSDHPF